MSLSSSWLNNLERFWSVVHYFPKKEILLNSQWEPWCYILCLGATPAFLRTCFKNMKNDTESLQLSIVLFDFFKEDASCMGRNSGRLYSHLYSKDPQIFKSWAPTSFLDLKVALSKSVLGFTVFSHMLRYKMEFLSPQTCLLCIPPS